tara:strand:- start:511 stop:720 length:210 start_codon:yes stop_codon:yes gene_type:complete
MTNDDLGFIGQGVFNILKRFINDKNQRYQVTEKITDIMILVLEEELTRRYYGNHSHSDHDNTSVLNQDV